MSICSCCTMTVQRMMARKTPRRMQRPRLPRKKLKQSQSIIILWFAVSLRYFGRIRKKVEPCTYALIVSTYSVRTKRNMKHTSSTASSTNLKSSSCLIQMTSRKQRLIQERIQIIPRTVLLVRGFRMLPG